MNLFKIILFNNITLINYLSDMFSPLDAVLIGAGRAGEFNINSLNKTKLFNLRYIVDYDLDKADKLSKKYHGYCATSNDLDLLLNCKSDITVLIIATSTQTHYNLTKKCLISNKHVLCEKPLGNENEMKELYRIAEKNNLKLLVGYQKRFDPEYQNLYDKIKNKTIKNIRTVTRDNPIPPIEYLKTSGGIIEDMVSHDIDIINQFMDNKVPVEIECIFSTTNKELYKNGEIEDINIIMKYSNGVLVSLNGSRTASYGYDQRMEVFCEEGLFVMENKRDDNLIEYDNSNKKDSKINYSFKERYHEAYLNELEHFYKVINEDICLKEDLPRHIFNKKICNRINSIINNKKEKYDKVITLRNYKEDTKQHKFYNEQHLNQTYESVGKLIEKYSKLDKKEMYMYEALDMLDNFVDPSDPDVDLPNSIHAYQTAERIRKKYPLDKQLQITGLIHDLGKVLFDFGEPSYNVVGDTYVLGSKFPDTIVYFESLKDNPDNKNDKFMTELGIYKKNCGLDNLRLAFGHDEYLYLVLNGNKNHKLEQKYLDIIRFHSFYPWHTSNSYKYFMNDKDITTLNDVKKLNQFDLYSKEDIDFEMTDNIREYYSKLLDEYFPEKLKW